ncbi:DNA-directed DNA polymerase [Variovorax sp. PCZ-1]|uniref:DNA polymerase Y family protein n=1 Tax=Variovorax sp. PCZ-1 TaxID=2835533 RepID=UPI001BCAF773|nr:DNA-directed DNA polymerase [Variovorax sp. PCZ-1]MBS7808107.1 DNA-directed DNA polymerase [Variovorax sp. PCZ-1]
MLPSFFVDFNSFFASVEQQLDVNLRGRPVGVVPVMAETSCCIAASIEAKKFGVKTGTGVRDARKLCPEIVFVHAQHEKYVAVHEKAVVAVDRILPVKQVMSIDEMECELPLRFQTREHATRLSGLVKQEILDSVGDQLQVSIGVAPNTMLAKLASDMMKPNGLVIIEQHEIPEKLLHLKLQDITGVGRRMLVRLNDCGIHNMADLYAAPRDLLHTAWGGVAGDEMYDKLRGVAYGPRKTESRSLGHSHMLPPAMRNPTDALAVLHRLTQKAAMRLRKQGFYATAFSVSVRCGHGYSDHGGGHREARMGQTQDTAILLHTLDLLWHSGLHLLMRPKAVGMVLHGLVPASQHTPGLFDAPPQDKASKAPIRERAKLLHALDGINRRYGKNALYFATAHGALDHAPMRIAFNRIPDIETER